MIRLFETHRVRYARELDGMWDFEKEGSDKRYSMPVPSCWEQHPDLLSYRGKGVYRKKVYLNKKSNIRLEFKGVSHTADVYFDGVKTAHHYNAFTPFSAVIKNAEAGEHEIEVRVSNAFGEQSALHIPNDYYTYGGITRPAALEIIPDVYIKNIKFIPSVQNGSVKAVTEINICSVCGEEKTVVLKTELAGRIAESEITIKPDSEEKNRV